MLTLKLGCYNWSFWFNVRIQFYCELGKSKFRNSNLLPTKGCAWNVMNILLGFSGPMIQALQPNQVKGYIKIIQRNLWESVLYKPNFKFWVIFPKGMAASWCRVNLLLNWKIGCPSRIFLTLAYLHPLAGITVCEELQRISKDGSNLRKY